MLHTTLHRTVCNKEKGKEINNASGNSRSLSFEALGTNSCWVLIPQFQESIGLLNIPFVLQFLLFHTNIMKILVSKLGLLFPSGGKVEHFFRYRTDLAIALFL